MLNDLLPIRLPNSLLIAPVATPRNDLWVFKHGREVEEGSQLNKALGGTLYGRISGVVVRVAKGKVEYIAAGSGFGPDILEAAADLFKRPLVLGAGWHPAIQLFKRYGGTVTPRGVSHFQPLQRNDPRALPAKYDVKNMASDAYNRRDLGWGVLPRYQTDAARFQEDPAKLAADEQR